MSKLTRPRLVLFLLMLLFAALIYSKFLLSIGMIGLVLVGFWPHSQSWSVHLQQLGQNFRSFLPYPALGLLFFIILYTGLYSEDTAYWLERLRIKLPFLILPLAFAGLPKLPRSYYHYLYGWLLLVMTLSCIGVGINYWLHYEEILVAIGQGQAVPTPNNHIRFSLLVVIAILGGIRLWQSKESREHPFGRHLILGMTLFLFVFLHVLAVRSGLATMYLTLSVGGVQWLWTTGRRRWLPVIGLAMVLLPWAAYQLIPSFKTKVGYTLWDWKMYQEEKGSAYSDAGRWISLELAGQLFQEQPILGVGAGDLKIEMERKYQRYYPEIKVMKRPHNQFLTILAGTGLLGMGFFLLAILTPLFFRRHVYDRFFFLLYTLLMASFMVENTIENAVGVGVFLLFILIELHRLRTEMLVSEH